MKLAISNIAWDKHDDPEILSLLRENGIKGIEIAPTKVWPEWSNATQASANAYRKQLFNEGFEIPALQAIVYGKPKLQLFNFETKQAFIDHFKFVAELSSALGAKVLVFGAPKNRLRGQLSTSDAIKYAAEVMHTIGEICCEYDVCIGWEHNPVEYGCDFITNAADAKEFVELINSPGIQLHLDSGGIHMCGGNIENTIQTMAPFVHYHISEPMLEPLANGIVDHKTALQTLQKINYTDWISIEMKPIKKTLLEQSIQKVTA